MKHIIARCESKADCCGGNASPIRGSASVVPHVTRRLIRLNTAVPSLTLAVSHPLLTYHFIDFHTIGNVFNTGGKCKWYLKCIGINSFDKYIL